MRASTDWIILVLFWAFPCWGATGEPPSLTDLRRQVSDALRSEATATSPAAQINHTLELVALAQHLATRPERRSSSTWQQTYRRVVARLRSVSRRWQSRLRHQRLDTIPQLPKTVLAQVAQAADRAGVPRRRRNAAGPVARQTQLANQLIAIIERTVSPQSWVTRGGAATITYWPRGAALVIRAPQAVHEEVGPLLGQLRR